RGDFRDIQGLDTTLGQQMLAIYEQAFPQAEREPIENIAASLKTSDPDSQVTRLRVLLDQGLVVGFTFFSSYKEYYLGYLKFIAVRADIRSRGYGPQLLADALQDLRGDGRRATGWPYLGVVLEVERPETADNDQDRQLRERRIQFYQRNGAVLLESMD